MVAFPPFRLDSDEGRLWKGETLLALRRKPFEILRYLAQNPKRLVTHDELLAKVWGGTVVSESSMRSHMHELRRVLGEGVIETVIGRGYRFIADVRDDVERRTPECAPDDPLVVGRDAEIEQLRAAFDRACAGQRQLCFVTGEPGIGKTTLVRTFLAGLDSSKVIVARGACFEQHGTPEPYLAILDAVGSLARSERRAQVLAALVRHAPTFLAQVPHLVDDEQRADVSRRAAGSSESRQLRELCEALEALSARDPLVLVLEDLQWSDVATIDLLSMLAQRQERARVLVIATSRHAEIQSPEHPLNRVMRGLVARSFAHVLPVPKVGVSAVGRFIDQRFAGHSFPPRLTELVARITGGTPLFMVSLLDELEGREMLAEGDEGWKLQVSIDEVEAHRPASVKQLIDIQLDRLPLPEQRVLEAASVVGAEFATSLVAAALELPVEEVDDTCDSLRRRALFLRAEPDERYGFHHALIQEVCVERSSPARRRRWHRLVAEALEPFAGEQSHLLAKHFDAAGAADQAVAAYVMAARHAAARYATSDAVALCARALDLLPRLAPAPERDRLELQILETMCDQVSANSFSASFAGRDPLAVHERAIEIARSSGDPGSVYAAITRLCNYYMIVAQYDRSTEALRELERIEQEHVLGPELLHAGIFARAYIAFFRGELATALRLLERLTHEEPFRANLAGRALALGHLACVRCVVGDPERALREATEAIELATRSEVPVLLSLGHVVRIRLRFLGRDLVEDEAEQAVRAAAVDLGLLAEAKAYALWVSAQRRPLELSAIEPLLDDLDHRLTEVSTCSTLVALMLIDTLRVSGHLARARELTDQIIAFAIAHDELVYLPELLRVRGLQREATDPAAAIRDHAEAVALARSCGASGLERRAQESLSALRGR